jgi:hypothetical protein
MSLKYLYYLLFIFFVSFLSIQAVAQNFKITESRDVVFIFYKTAEMKPNFESWAKDGIAYRTAPLTRQEEVLKRETEKLEREFQEFSLKDEVITIKTKVEANLEKREEDGNYILKMNFLEGEADYFPYEYEGEHFAVVPKDLKTRLNSIIPEGQYNRIRDEVGENGKVKAVLQLKPLRAETDAPFEVDEVEQWVLLTEVASLSLWGNDGFMVWNYSAPWYMTPMTRDLIELRENDQELRKELLELKK